jgi:death-on-curing protein
MRYLTLNDLLFIYYRVMEQSGGLAGVRDMGALETALSQPLMTFGGEDLYPTLAAKAAALGYTIIQNHPFIDGNKRAGHAALETFLVLNGHELNAAVDEQERVILQVAAGIMRRDAFSQWVEEHVVPLAV